MKKYIRCIIAFMLIMNGSKIFAQEDGDDNIPYLTDEDIAAIEIILPEDPVEIPEIISENTELAENGKDIEIQANEFSRLNTSRPIYHLLILDRRNSPLNSDISGIEGIKMIYKFKHGANGFLIVLFKSSDKGPVFPVMPDESRIVVDVVSTYKSTIRDYINSSAFRRYVTSRKITTGLQTALNKNI